MKSLAVLVSSLLLSTSAFASDLKWQSVSINSDKVTLTMPGKPTEKNESSSSIVGDVNTQIYKVVVPDDGNVTIACSDLPGAALFFAGKDTIYGNAKGKFLSGAYGKELSWDPITYEGIDGMKLMFQTPPLKGHPGYDGEAQFYLVGDYLYVISVTDLVGSDLKMQDKVFTSLKFADASSGS
ncbi:hypothetical protein [Cerasicoccus maritimus]|uniref:hypothetical protein n=1 Tax=Cerasicoccus maritimus TaxID=490089 RepID=UPI0028527D6F|nr:hypothetical protein [Cerasicoccus maritimus]